MIFWKFLGRWMEIFIIIISCLLFWPDEMSGYRARKLSELQS
jgi:hypothetical protein